MLSVASLKEFHIPSHKRRTRSADAELTEVINQSTRRANGLLSRPLSCHRDATTTYHISPPSFPVVVNLMRVCIINRDRNSDYIKQWSLIRSMTGTRVTGTGEGKAEQELFFLDLYF
jgi:hypothetical protein